MTQSPSVRKEAAPWPSLCQRLAVEIRDHGAKLIILLPIKMKSGVISKPYKSQPAASSQLFLWASRSILLMIILLSFGPSPGKKRQNLSQISLSISYRQLEYLTSFNGRENFILTYPEFLLKLYQSYLSEICQKIYNFHQNVAHVSNSVYEVQSSKAGFGPCIHFSTYMMFNDFVKIKTNIQFYVHHQIMPFNLQLTL